MGTIKDLVDLITQLSTSIQGRKFAPELQQIHSMITSLQSEQAELHERNFALLSDNTKLTEENSALKTQIQKCADWDKEKLRYEPIRFSSNTIFYQLKGTDEHFCPACFEGTHQAIHLQPPAERPKRAINIIFCPICKTEYKP